MSTALRSAGFLRGTYYRVRTVQYVVLPMREQVILRIEYPRPYVFNIDCKEAFLTSIFSSGRRIERLYSEINAACSSKDSYSYWVHGVCLAVANSWSGSLCSDSCRKRRGIKLLCDVPNGGAGTPLLLSRKCLHMPDFHKRPDGIGFCFRNKAGPALQRRIVSGGAKVPAILADKLEFA
jgi:hypothetical protein